MYDPSSFFPQIVWDQTQFAYFNRERKCPWKKPKWNCIVLHQINLDCNKSFKKPFKKLWDNPTIKQETNK